LNRRQRYSLHVQLRMCCCDSHADAPRQAGPVGFLFNSTTSPLPDRVSLKLPAESC
jgi:hypothetical protein